MGYEQVVAGPGWLPAVLLALAVLLLVAVAAGVRELNQPPDPPRRPAEPPGHDRRDQAGTGTGR